MIAETNAYFTKLKKSYYSKEKKWSNVGRRVYAWKGTASKDENGLCRKIDSFYFRTDFSTHPCKVESDHFEVNCDHFKVDVGYFTVDDDYFKVEVSRP